MDFFSDIEKSILQLTWNLRGPTNNQNNLRTAKLQAADFRTYYKGSVIKRV